MEPRFLPTPTRYINYDNVRQGTRLMSPDGLDLQPDTVSLMEDLGEVPHFRLTLQRQERLTSPCENSYTKYPYELDIVLSNRQHLLMADGKYISPAGSLNAQLWVPTMTHYQITTQFDVPPYWYAALLGAGCVGSEDPPTMSFPSQEFFNVMQQYDSNSYYVRPYPLEEGSSTYPLISYINLGGKSELWRDLDNLESVNTSWWNAFVPTTYKFGIVPDRLRFMQGLLDYKGWINDKGEVQVLVTSEILHNDIHWLVRSMGGWTASGLYSCHDPKAGWVMTIYIPGYMHPFGVARDNYIPSIVAVPPWIVKKVEALGLMPYRSIRTTLHGGYTLFGEVIVKHT